MPDPVTQCAEEWTARARSLESEERLPEAASAWNHAYALAPDDEDLQCRRCACLDRLEVVEEGIRFRYVPAGTFHMGSELGDHDECPRHPVHVPEFWIAEAPTSWAQACELLGFFVPPIGQPRTPPADRMERFQLLNQNKVRLQYCEDSTAQAQDWHSHADNLVWRSGLPRSEAEKAYGSHLLEDRRRPQSFCEKPMVAVSPRLAEDVAQALTKGAAPGLSYGLPSEVQWEKAARGGLIDQPYPWGSDEPSGRCDFNAFQRFGIAPSRQYPPNGYGLYSMAGGVWEWTSELYDAAAYQLRASLPTPDAPAPGLFQRLRAKLKRHEPNPPARAELRVIRGGSWADCASAVRVSFRACQADQRVSANIGFRLARWRQH